MITILLLLASVWVTAFGRADGSVPAAMSPLSEIERFESWSIRTVRLHGIDPGAGDTQVFEIPGSILAHEEQVRSICDEMMTRFRDDGYLLSRIHRFEVVPDSLARSVELVIFVDRGPRCSVASITLNGNRSLDSEDFVRLTGITVGTLVTGSLMRRGLDNVAQWYADNGYPYAEVEFEQFEILPDGDVDIALRFDEGRRIRIGDVSVRGNRLTREAVVLKQFGVRPDDTFSMREIRKGRERLVSSKLYSDVSEVRLVKGEHSHKVDLEIRVEEEKPNLFNGAAGLVPGPGGSVRPTGSLDLSLGNLWGTARKMNIRWIGRGGGNSQLDIRYLEPWIGGSPISGEFRFAQELRDTTFSRLEFVFVGLGPIGPHCGVKAGVEHQSIYSVFSSDGEANTNGRLSVLLGAYRTSAPGRGWKMDVEFLIGRRRIDGERFGEVEGKGSIFMTLWSRMREDIRLNLGGRFIRSPIRPVPAYQLFSLGSGETVRGYAEDRIWGNIALWNQTEFSFGVHGRSRYLLFYDLGIVDTSGDRRGGRIIHGYGAGLRIESRFGVMRIDYALNPDLGPLEGRLHAGWTQGF